MKKWSVAILLCFLVGCSGQPSGMQEALDFRTGLTQGAGCTFDAMVTADLGEHVYTFDLDCGYTVADKSAQFTIVAPEEIAGISAQINGETANFTFDDVALSLDTGDSDHLPPLLVPKLLGDSWVGGFIQWATVEEDGFTIQYALEQPREIWVQTVFSQDMVPQSCEIYLEGVRVLQVELTDFAIGTGR